MSTNVKTDRGCIGSSGNVRKGRLDRGLSWWNMGKLVFPGEWRLYVKSLQLSMWSSSWFSPWLPVSNQSINQSMAWNPKSWSRGDQTFDFGFFDRFPNFFFKISAKMLYLGPIYPRKVRFFEICNFLPPLAKKTKMFPLVPQNPFNFHPFLIIKCIPKKHTEQKTDNYKNI